MNTIEKTEKKEFEQLAYSVRQIAELSSLSMTFVRDEIKCGKLRAIRRRGRLLILRSALENYFKEISA